MMTLDSVRSRLRPMNLSKVSKEAGVSAASVYRLMKSDSKPSYDVVKALSDYLSRIENEGK